MIKGKQEKGRRKGNRIKTEGNYPYFVSQAVIMTARGGGVLSGHNMCIPLAYNQTLFSCRGGSRS